MAEFAVEAESGRKFVKIKLVSKVDVGRMSNRINELRSRREIKKMRAAGLVVWEAHQTAAKQLRAGITTAQINAIYRETFIRHNAEPLFLNYPGTPPFPAETCISVNDEVVHGIPGERVLKEGDIVSLDTGCRLQGWCGDAAVTHAIGKIDAKSAKLLKATQQVLDLAIELMDKHTKWSLVAEAMDEFVMSNGFSTVIEMSGHGIGRELHEPPSVPHFLSEGLLENDFEIRPGLVIAVEPMVNVGGEDIKGLADGWTVVTSDGSRSAHFEHTIAVTKEGAVRLTGPPSEEELQSMPEWLHDSSQWVRW